MPFPFGKSPKSPAEIVRTLKENVAHMEKLDAGDSKKCEKVSNRFTSVRKLSFILITNLQSKSQVVFPHLRLQKRSPKIWPHWRRFFVEQVTRSLKLKQWLSLHKSCTTPTSSLLSLQTCKGLILRSVKCASFCADFYVCKNYWLLCAGTKWSVAERTPDFNIFTKSKIIFVHLCMSSVSAIHLFFFLFQQGKKDVVHLFSNIVRRQIGTRTPTVEYISTHPQILFMLLKG